MRKVDPSIKIVAVGNTINSYDPDDPGRLWNEVIIREAGNYIEYLSFHLYQPDQDGWNDDQDADELYSSVCAASNEAERMIFRLGKLIEKESPSKKIGIALDEWNLWPTPSKTAGSLHQIVYALRDALYCVAMLNVFHWQSRYLSMANVAQLVNVLPLIVTTDEIAITISIYWPFWMYTHMQKVAVRSEIKTKLFISKALGKNVPAETDVPFLDFSATRSENSEKLVLSLINRHPTRKITAEILMDEIPRYLVKDCFVLSGSKPMSANTIEHPDEVTIKEKNIAEHRNGKLMTVLPPCSVSVITLEKKL